MSDTINSLAPPGDDYDLDEARSFFEFDAPVASTIAPAPIGAAPPPPPIHPSLRAPATANALATPPPALAAPTIPALAPPAAVPQFATLDALADLQLDASPTPKPRRKGSRKSRGRKAAGRLLVLALIAGAIGGGVVYGSDIVEFVKGEEQPTVTRSFPEPSSPPPEIRTATFEVENPNENQTYEVTTDFATGISRVMIEREDLPDLEMLTLFDEAVVRRTDETTWYRLGRGQFPVDVHLGRERWVRTLDEVFPSGIRRYATIDRATDSVVGVEETRHLVVTIDAERLASAKISAPIVAPAAGAQVAVEPAVEEPQAASNAEASPPTNAGPAPALVPAPSETPVAAVANNDVTLELWVDDSGTLRKLLLPEALGGETVTISSISPEAWQPEFPAQEAVQPLTASDLFGLGL